METKQECACSGIGLLRAMLRVYPVWEDDNLSGQRKAKAINARILEHLSTQSRKLAPSQLRAVEVDIDKIRAGVVQAGRYSIKERSPGMTTQVMTLDVIRDKLHQNKQLREVLLCNHDENANSPSRAADTIGRVLEEMAGDKIGSFEDIEYRSLVLDVVDKLFEDESCRG